MASPSSLHRSQPLQASTPHKQEELLQEEAGREGLSDPLSPLIISSGYLTKRSSGRLRTRWLRRWWQLLGDGTLIYFKGEERLRVLAEIDIAHTCYDVRLGSEHCSISFPTVIPSNCCLSFSVLKRTYYLFAPTPTEAAKWSNVLRQTSYILNRSRPRELSVNPAILVAAEELEAPPPVPPSVPPPSSSHKAPPPPPLSSSMESDDEPKQLPKFQSYTRGTNFSVPDLRIEYGGGTKYAHQTRFTHGYHNNSYLATGNSSQQSQTSSMSSTCTSQPSHYQPINTSSGTATATATGRVSNRSQSFLVTPSGTSIGDSSKRRHTMHQSDYRKKLSKEGVAREKKPVQKRSSLNTWYTSTGDLLNSSTLPSPGKLARSKWKSQYDTMETDHTHQRLEELHKQEADIKRRLKELKKSERQSFTGPAHGIPVLPLSPVENISYAFQTDESLPTNQSQTIEERPIESGEAKKKRQGPRKAPKPSMKRIKTPFTLTNDTGQTNEGKTDQGRIMGFNEDSKRKSSAIRSYEANVWVREELRKVNK